MLAFVQSASAAAPTIDQQLDSLSAESKDQDYHQALTRVGVAVLKCESPDSTEVEALFDKQVSIAMRAADIRKQATTRTQVITAEMLMQQMVDESSLLLAPRTCPK